MDDVTREYLELCRAQGSPLRDVVGALALPPRFRQAYEARLTSRPFFASERALRDVAQDLAGLYDLLLSLPGRLFDGNVDRYAAALNIDPVEAGLMRRLGDRPPACTRGRTCTATESPSS